MWLVLTLTSKRRPWLSDYIFVNRLIPRSQCTCVQTAWTGGWWNISPLSFSCSQGSTSNEIVFNSNGNCNARIKKLEGIFSTIWTSRVDYGENNMMNCNYSSWKVFSCTCCSFRILQLSVSSSLLRVESMKVVFFQKSLISSCVEVVWSSLSPFLNSNRTHWTPHFWIYWQQQLQLKFCCACVVSFWWPFMESTWITIPKTFSNSLFDWATKEYYMLGRWTNGNHSLRVTEHLLSLWFVCRIMKMMIFCNLVYLVLKKTICQVTTFRNAGQESCCHLCDREIMERW